MGAVCKKLSSKAGERDILEEFEDLLDDAALKVEPESILEELSRSCGPAAKKFVIVQLKPKLAPLIEKYDLQWDDLVPVLELMDTVEELRAALAHPAQFLVNLGEAGSPAARQLAVAKLKPALLPLLDQEGLMWDDVLPVLDQLDSLEELRAAIQDPKLFLEKMETSLGPAGKKLVIAKLRPQLAPHLKQYGITWLDLVPVLDQIDSVDEIRSAVKDPGKFLLDLQTGSGAVAHRMAIARLLAKIEYLCEREGITRKDVLPVLEQYDSVDELRAALRDPKEFFDELVRSVRPIAKQLLIARLRPRLAPLLRSQGLGITFRDLKPALEQVDSVQELQEAVSDPAEFLERLHGATTLAGKKFVIAQLHSRLPTFLEREGLAWEDVSLALDKVDSGEALRAALSEPEGLFEELANSEGAAGRLLAIARLRVPLSPILWSSHGLAWKDFFPVLEQIDSVKTLDTARAKPEKFLTHIENTRGVCARKMAIAKLKTKITVQLEEKYLQWDDLLPVLEKFESVEELRAAMLSPKEFLKELMQSVNTSAKRLLIAQLRHKLSPCLEKDSLTWSDVSPAIDQLNTATELEGAIDDPAAFLKKLKETQGKRMLIARLRPVLIPSLKRYGVTWQEFSTVLERIDSHQELKDALDNSNDFLQKLNASAENLGVSVSGAALWLAILKLRPKLAPLLRKRGLTLEDMGPVFAELIALDVKEATANPEQFLEDLGTNFNGLAGRKFATAQLRNVFSAYVEKHGLKWVDVAWALEEVDTVEELRRGVSPQSTPEGFLAELKESTGAVRRRLLIAELRPKMVDDVEGKGITFDDIIPALDQMDEEALLAKLKVPSKHLPPTPSVQGSTVQRPNMRKVAPGVEPPAQPPAPPPPTEKQPPPPPSGPPPPSDVFHQGARRQGGVLR